MERDKCHGHEVALTDCGMICTGFTRYGTAETVSGEMAQDRLAQFRLARSAGRLAADSEKTGRSRRP